MNSGLTSLHKILKDETRRKIILLLNEKGSLSYTDLKDTLEILSTGMLNYHLKVLGELLSKNETGEYILTEKGRLASRLLLEFPEEHSQELGRKPKWWRRFWIEITIFVAVAFVITLGAYFLGYMDINEVWQSMISIVSATAFAYMIQHILRDVLSKKRQLIVAKVVWTGLGAWLGWAATFFGAVFISALFRFSGKTPPLANSGGWWFLVLTFGIAPIIGAILGYWFGKRRHFQTAHYIPDPQQNRKP